MVTFPFAFPMKDDIFFCHAGVKGIIFLAMHMKGKMAIKAMEGCKFKH